MEIYFIHGDIVEQKAEGLACSGDINLNMSGGVNGTLLSRGEQDLQRQLHQYLKDNGLNFVQPGFGLEIGPGIFPSSASSIRWRLTAGTSRALTL